MDLLIPPAPEIGNTAVELVNAGVSIPTPAGRRWLFRGLTVSLRPGQCTGIVGRNGAGKSTLLRVCMGHQDPEEGTSTIGKRVVWNYIDQGREQLNGAGTVLEEIGGTSGMVAFGDRMITVRSYLRRFLFDEARINERVEKLSGGERARLMLAKSLCRGGNVIVLDEPTNDLDLGSLRMLEEALAAFDGTILVVSHDRYFLDRVCDQILAFEEGGIHVQPGNFSYYLEKKKEREQGLRRREPAFAQPPRAGAAIPDKTARKWTNKEKAELDGMEAAIEQAEGEARGLEDLLNDPAFHVQRGGEAPGVLEQLNAVRARIEALYARWEELTSYE